MTYQNILLGSAAFFVAAFIIALLALKRLAPQAVGLFLLLAPFNYFYVLVFEWQITWGYAGNISEGAPTLAKYAKDIIFLLIFSGWFIGFLLSRKKRRIRLGYLDLLVCLFVGYQILMVVPAADEIGIVPGLTALWVNCGYALGYFMMRSVLSEGHIGLIRAWAAKMIPCGGVIALIGFWQVFFSPSVGNYTVGNLQNVTRAYSTMGSPNNLGMYLCILLVLSLMYGLYRGSILRLVSTFCAAGCLLMTVSMSALFGAVVITGLFFVKARNWKRLLVIACLVAVGIILVISMVPAVGTRVVTSLSGNETSWLLRVENWKRLFPDNLETIIFGAGGGVAGMTVSFTEIDRLADNQYLAIILQFGLIGVAIYGLLLLAGGNAALRESLNLLGAFSASNRMVAGMIVLLVAIWGGVANIMNVFPINVYFWCALAIVASSSRDYVCDRA